MTTKAAVWNKYPFHCPGPCGRHFERDTIRVKHIRAEWMCQGCADALTSTITPADIAVGICTTCGQPARSGKRTVNADGRIVHKGGCPSKAERTARRERRRRTPGQ